MIFKCLKLMGIWHLISSHSLRQNEMSAVLRSFKPCLSPAQVSTSELSHAAHITAASNIRNHRGSQPLPSQREWERWPVVKAFSSEIWEQPLLLGWFQCFMQCRAALKEACCPPCPVTRVCTEEMGDESSTLCSGGRNKMETVCFPAAWVLWLYICGGQSCCLLVISRWLGCKAPALLVCCVGRLDI